MLVKIYFSNGISEHRIDSKIPQSIQIKFDSVPKKVLVEKITINDIEANIYQNTVFHIANSTEKLTLNFIVYRHNMENHNAQIFEPGHMERSEDYDKIAKKFGNIYKDWQFSKNQIYDLVKESYIPY